MRKLIQIKIALSLGVSLLLIALSSAGAHELDYVYDRNDPVPIVVKYRRSIYLKLWEPIISIKTTIPPDALSVEIDKNFPTTATLTNLKKKTTGLVYFTTTSGLVVHAKVKHWGRNYQVIRVTDGRTELNKALEAKDRANVLSPEEKAVRKLWRRMWGYPVDKGQVQSTEMDFLANRDPIREIRTIRRYETVGFYGYTQRITNVSTAHLPIHPASIQLDCPIFSAGLDLGPDHPNIGSNTYRLPPGDSLLVHIVCKGVDYAPVR